MRLASKGGLPVRIAVRAPISGTGAQVVNVFKVHGPVRIIEQVAEIVEITTLTNLTNVYSTLYDGTNTINLTLPGATLSGAPIGSIFTRDLDSTNPYSVLLADECRMSEVTSEKEIGRPFTVIPKTGADTFIRFHYTTTDNPVDFVMYVKFIYQPVDGGYITIV